MKRLLSVLLVVGVSVAAIVFRHAIIAWFAGRPEVVATGVAVQAGAPSQVAPRYTCPMHPSVNEPRPGKCPICGMELTLVHVAGGAAMVTVNEGQRQLIGVRTEEVVSAPMHVSTHAVAQVVFDESRLTDVTLKVRGWITHLSVSRTGERVARGQPLFALYSPDLLGAQQDFLVAQRGNPDGGLGAAARERLRLLDMSEGQIDALAARGAPSANVVVTAPAAGVVVEKNVVEGAAVEPGARVFRLAALDRVWIEAEVYEADLGHVTVGERASVTLDYVPDRTFDTTVAYVYPYLDPKTRTGRVRVELPNESLELRPGMYAHVALAADLGPRVQVPRAALIYTGRRRVVFVDAGGDRFEAREVTPGAENEESVEVLSGVAAGERVAVSGVFLLAAEARIRTSADYWSADKP